MAFVPVAPAPLRLPGLEPAATAVARDHFGGIAVVDSNHKAVEAGRRFAKGEIPFLILLGPSGWGKSHLVQAIVCEIRHERGLPVLVENLGDSITRNAATSRNPLVIEGCDSMRLDPRHRQLARRIIHRRTKQGNPTLMTFSSPSIDRDIHELLGATRRVQFAVINEPKGSERLSIVEHLCSECKLKVHPAICRLIAYMVPGSGCSIGGALRRLQMVSDDWQSPEAVLRACGLIEPLLIDATPDIRDLVNECVLEATEKSRLNTKLEASDLTAHLLLRDLGLTERSVAAFFHETEGFVYQRAASVSRLASTDEGYRVLLHSRNAVISRLRTLEHDSCVRIG